MSQQSTRRFILIVAVIVIIAAIALFFFNHKNKSTPSQVVQQIDYSGLPSLGSANAPNKILAIEDLKCHGCMIYNNAIYPQLQKELIDTGKVSYHVLLVSFIPGSEPAANAALCLYSQKPDYFFQFIKTSYLHQPPENENWATPARLIEIAKLAAPQADLNTLSQCMLTDQFGPQLKKNVAYGAKLMGNELITPTLFLNGRKLNSLTLDSIKPLLK